MENNPGGEQHTGPLPSLHPQMWAPPPHQHFIPYPAYAIAPREMPWVMPHNIQEMPMHHWIPQAEQYPFPVAPHPTAEHPVPEHPPAPFRQEGYFIPYFPPPMYDPSAHFHQEAPLPESAKPKPTQQAASASAPPSQKVKKPPRPRETPTSQPSQRRGPGTKIERSPQLALEVLHKPRGSQGVWKPIEEKQRLRVTLGRGKNLRLVVRPTEAVDWSSLHISLVERIDENSDLWDECPPVNNFSVESRQTIEEEDTATGAKLKSMQLEVKLYAIHKTVAFKASIKSAATSDVYTTISFEMLTHNSGRRDAEVKRKQLEAAQAAMGVDGNGNSELLPPEAKRPRRATAIAAAQLNADDEDDDDPTFIPPGLSDGTHHQHHMGNRASNLKAAALREMVGGDDDENDEDFVLDTQLKSPSNTNNSNKRRTPTATPTPPLPQQHTHHQPLASASPLPAPLLPSSVVPTFNTLPPLPPPSSQQPAHLTLPPMGTSPWNSPFMLPPGQQPPKI